MAPEIAEQPIGAPPSGRAPAVAHVPINVPDDELLSRGLPKPLVDPFRDVDTDILQVAGGGLNLEMQWETSLFPVPSGGRPAPHLGALRL